MQQALSARQCRQARWHNRGAQARRLPPTLPACCQQVGNGKLTPSEQKAHFALWALLKAPLLIGTDLRSASEGAAMNGRGAVSERGQQS